MEDVKSDDQTETIETNESDNNISIELNETINSDEAQIHKLTVEDAVTQIEIEHNEQDKQQHKSAKNIEKNQPNPQKTLSTTNKNNDNCDNNKTSLSPIPIAPDNTPPPPPTTTTIQLDPNPTLPTLPATNDIDIKMNDKSSQKEEQDDEEDEDDDISMKNSGSSTNQDTDDNFDPLAPCGVCWVSVSFPGDDLVYCDGCNVPLHQSCYCINTVPEGDYYCKVCQHQIEQEGKPSRNKDFLGRKCKCSICQLRFRSKKLAYTGQKKSELDLQKGTSTKEKWCHVICAQYVSETWFDEQQSNLNGVCNVDGIRDQRYADKCAYCQRTKGAKVFCSIMGCPLRFHASCGLVNNCMLQDVADPDAEYSNRVVYCPQHLPGIIKKNGNPLQEKRLQESQDISINGNQNNLGWGETWDHKIQAMSFTASFHEKMSDQEDDIFCIKPRNKRARASKKNKRKKKVKEKNKNNLKLKPPSMISQPPPLAPIYSRRGGFFHTAAKSTGPRSMGAGPGNRAKKKFAANYKKRKEAPKLNGNHIYEPPSKKQRLSNTFIPPPHAQQIPQKNLKLNPNHIPKRTMPKYIAKELNQRSAPKKFEQKGKVRFIKPNLPPIKVKKINKINKIQKNIPPQSQNQPLQPPPPIITEKTYKIFPKRASEIWNTRMISHDSDLDVSFAVTFVWRAGCKLSRWPFKNMCDANYIHCSWKKDFCEMEKYMGEIRPGGVKQHLSHHWMLCEIHPYSTEDVNSYGDFCNYYKDLNKVSAAMCKSMKHQHLLFYLCPPDENVLPEQYLDDIFDCKIPKGLLWCLIFVKNLNVVGGNGGGNGGVVGKNLKVIVSNNLKDPRRKKEKKKREKIKGKVKEKVKVKVKEKGEELVVEVDGGNLLGILENLQDTLKDEANVGGDVMVSGLTD